MFIADRLTLDAPRRTSDGYMVVRAKAARTGVYQYAGRDVDPDNAHGLRDTPLVNVLRDADTVFDRRSMHSFIGKPITDDHPAESVTAANWRDHARGTVMGAVRDGDHIAFDLLLTDASAIAAVDAGKRELSNGYDSKLEYGSFKAADGTDCPVRQASITGNHVALVRAGRAGPSCRIADAAHCDAAPTAIFDALTHQEKPIVKTMLIDGLTVDVANADTAIATINTLLAARDEAKRKLADEEQKVATLTGDKATLEGKLRDAAVTPQQLRDAAKNYANIVGKAKALGVAVTDAMDEPAIMKAVVSAKVGDAAAGFDEKQIAACFVAVARDAKVADADPLRDAISGQPMAANDAAGDAYAAMVRDMTGQKTAEGGK